MKRKCLRISYILKRQNGGGEYISHKEKYSPPILLKADVFYLLVSQLLPQVGHHVAQLGGADEAVAVLVKHPEGLPDLLLARKKVLCENLEKTTDSF